MKKKTIVFCGCGGLYNYSLGIAHVIQTIIKNKHTNNPNINYIGISAGAFPALLLSLNLNINNLFSTFNKDFLGEISRLYFGALFNWYDYVRIYTKKYIPSDSYKTNNLTISISVINTKKICLENRLVNKWDSNDELLDCITATSFIPIFGKKLYTKYKNKKCIDGCLTHNYNNQKDTDEIIYIYPSKWRKTNFNWYYCYSDIKWAEKIYQWGIDDAKKNIKYLMKFLNE